MTFLVACRSMYTSNLTATVILIALSLAGLCSGQGSRCDFLNFNPEQIQIREFGNTESYVFTKLPSSSCSNVDLNFINFCFLLARPKSNVTTETISEIAFLSLQNNMLHVEGIVPLLAETSYCDGETVQFQAWSLCCISRRITDYLNISFRIKPDGEISHNFALIAPSKEGITSYVAVGYRDFRIDGYVTNVIPESGRNLVIQQTVVPFLPVLSFTQDPVSYRKMSCPTQIPCTMTANSTASSSGLETETTDVVFEVGVQLVDTTGKDAAIAILVFLMVIFIVTSGVLGIFLLKVTRKANMKAKKDTTEKNTERMRRSPPSVVPPVSCHDYNLLSYSPPAAAGSAIDDYNVLHTCEVCQTCEGGERDVSFTGRKHIYSNGPAQPVESQSTSSDYRRYDYPQHCSHKPVDGVKYSNTGCDKSMSMKSNIMYGRTTISTSIYD